METLARRGLRWPTRRPIEWTAGGLVRSGKAFGLESLLPLTRAKYVERRQESGDDSQRKYRLGPAVTELGHRYLRHGK